MTTKTQTLILHNNAIALRAVKQVRQLMREASGDLWEVVIRPFKSKRSKAQNNTYWMWLTDISRQQITRYGDYRNEGYWHAHFALEFLPIETTVHYNGFDVPVPKSTKKLKVDAFSEYLQQIEVWAMERGVSLRFPDEYHLALGNSDVAVGTTPPLSFGSYKAITGCHVTISNAGGAR